MKSRPFGRMLTPALRLVSGAFFLICASQSASAITVSYVPSTQVVSVGDIAQVNIVVSDPNLGSTMAVIEFDIDTRFDTAILADKTEIMPTDAVFHGHLGIPGIETGANWGVLEDIALDVVKTHEWSTLNVGVIPLQSPSFTLATLYFEALAPGVSALEFSSVSIIGPGPNVPVTTTNASITVVPIPSALYLFGTGLIGLVGVARRKGHSS